MSYIPPSPGPVTAGQLPLTPDQDAKSNVGWAVAAYILFLIPLVAAPKNSRFARFHTNQGTVLALAGLVATIVGLIVSVLAFVASGVAVSTSWDLDPANPFDTSGEAASAIGFVLLPMLLTLSWLALPLLLLIPAILGIVNAATGKMKRLPLIGRITLIR